MAQYAFLGGRLFGMKTSSFTGMALSVPTNGTVVGLAAAASGAEIKRYDVLATPWGQQSADTGAVVRFRMGSQEYDQEIGLYHLGARYYDPSMGRFLSEDPSGIAGGLNLYAYAGNDPVQGIDPTGLSSDSPPVTLPGIPVHGGPLTQCYDGISCMTQEPTCGYNPSPNCIPPNTVDATNVSTSSPPAPSSWEPSSVVTGFAVATPRDMSACVGTVIAGLYTAVSDAVEIMGWLSGQPESTAIPALAQKARKWGQRAYDIFQTAVISERVRGKAPSPLDLAIDATPGPNLQPAADDIAAACFNR